MAYSIIGNPALHDVHAQHIVTGKAEFAADRLAGRKLYGAVKTATITHGYISRIDTAKALAEPGVKAVVTYKECPVWMQGILQWGQEVAGVVADDPATAARAATLVEVSYTVSPAVVDADAAMQPGANLAGVMPDTNTKVMTELKRGDTEAGFAQADVVLETAQPWSATYQPNTLETHQAVAWWVGGDLYVWGSSQSVHSGRSALMNIFGLDGSRVHVVAHFVGGSFYDKLGATAEAVAAAMSRAAGGQPVYFAETRQQNTALNDWQFPLRSVIRWGAKQDGTLTAVEARFWGDGGRNAFSPVSSAAQYGLKNTYTCPHAHITGTVITTNKIYTQRSRGDASAANYDAALDKLAHRLGLDPYALRLKNLAPADAPDQDPPGYVWGGNGLPLCFEKVHAESGYAQKWHAPGARTLPDGRRHGIAITGHLNLRGSVSGTTRGALMVMTADGKCLLNIGNSRASPGALTTMAMLVAETLGMKAEDVKVGEWGNTDVSLDSGFQSGTSFTGGAGSAFVAAALDLRAQLLAAAVTKPGLKDIAGLTVADLDAQNSEVFYVKDPRLKLTYRQVMSGTPPTSASSLGWAPTLRSHTVGNARLGDPCNTAGSSAACAEVAVDPETGEVEVLGLWNVVDTGRTINRQGTLKELDSGCGFMLHRALRAGGIVDAATGAALGDGYADDLQLTTLDLPEGAFHVYEVESDDAAGPYGAHGIGEPAGSNYSAIINAIYNATGAWVDTDKGACTPDKVLRALGKG